MKMRTKHRREQKMIGVEQKMNKLKMKINQLKFLFTTTHLSIGLLVKDY